MNDVFFRLKRKIASAMVRKKFVEKWSLDFENIGLVLYFDYEREFGNLAAKEKAETGFRSVIKILDEYGVSATWNCVGLIAEYYPQTLHQLVSLGHELASHTYHHFDATQLSQEVLKEELILCRKTFHQKFGVEIVGLHPPRDRWTIGLPGLLKGIGYRYMILRDDNPRDWHTYRRFSPFGRDILCIPSIADDWGYIEEYQNPGTMFRFWTERIAQLHPGWVAAIGFHPWVLGGEPSRLQEFAALIETLVKDDGITLVTAREVLERFER